MTKDGEEGWRGRKSREHKREDNVSPESAVKLPALSTHIYLPICLFPFLTTPSYPEIFPLSSWNKRDQMVPEIDTKQNHNTVKFNILYTRILSKSPWYLFFTSHTLLSCVCMCVYVCVLSPAGPPRQHPAHHTWCWPSRLYMTAQTVTSAPGRVRWALCCQ